MTDKKKNNIYNFLIFASVFIWTMMLGSKNVYTAELVEIVNIFNVTKPEASLAMTFYFITYSTAQVLMFLFLEKISIKWFLSISILLSGVVTVVVAFATGMWQLWWILSLNGILQAGVWGMCTAIFDKYLPSEYKPKANLIMNIGTAVAGVISYGSASLSLSINRWDLPFIILGIILSISGVVYFIAVQICDKNLVKNDTSTIVTKQTTSQMVPFTLKTSNKRTLFYIVSFIISLIAHSILYATFNWIPNLLTEVYMLDSSIAVLISILAPIATLIGPIFAINDCEKNFDFIKIGLRYLIIATAIALVLMFTFNLNVFLYLALIVVFLIVIQGIVTISFSIVSYKMCDYVNAGAHSGLMNAAGGYAAGFAPTIVGAILEATTWGTAYLVIFGTCLVLTIAVFVINMIIKSKKEAI